MAAYKYCQVDGCTYYTVSDPVTDCQVHGPTLGHKDRLVYTPVRRYVSFCEHTGTRIHSERPCVGGIATICADCGEEV